MDGLIQLAPDDLTTVAGVAKLNNMLQALFNNVPGDGTTVQDLSGGGSPEGVVTAGIGSTYRRTDGAAGTSFYVKSTGTGNTGWVAFSIPSLPLSQANGGTGTASGFPYVKCSNTQTSGTGSGTATSGGWNTVVLNTKDFDTSSIASLSGNQITLPAGTYLVKGYDTFLNTNNSQARLFNVTDSAVILIGTTAYAVAASVGAISVIMGQFTLASSKALSIQYQVNSTVATNGHGFPASFGSEIYDQIELFKIA